MAPSHLTRGAWIEIMILSIDSLPDSGRTSHEVRGLKFCSNTERISCIVTSHLTRGAWIEMIRNQVCLTDGCVAPHTRCVGGILVC
mgnify:CR=1 FL=1